MCLTEPHSKTSVALHYLLVWYEAHLHVLLLPGPEKLKSMHSVTEEKIGTKYERSVLYNGYMSEKTFILNSLKDLVKYIVTACG